MGAIVEPKPPIWRRIWQWYRSLYRRSGPNSTDDDEPVRKWEYAIIFLSFFILIGFGNLAVHVHWVFWIPFVLTLPLVHLFLRQPGSVS